MELARKTKALAIERWGHDRWRERYTEAAAEIVKMSDNRALVIEWQTSPGEK